MYAKNIIIVENIYRSCEISSNDSTSRSFIFNTNNFGKLQEKMQRFQNKIIRMNLHHNVNIILDSGIISTANTNLAFLSIIFQKK